MFAFRIHMSSARLAIHHVSDATYVIGSTMGDASYHIKEMIVGERKRYTVADLGRLAVR